MWVFHFPDDRIALVIQGRQFPEVGPVELAHAAGGRVAGAHTGVLGRIHESETSAYPLASASYPEM